MQYHYYVHNLRVRIFVLCTHACMYVWMHVCMHVFMLIILPYWQCVDMDPNSFYAIYIVTLYSCRYLPEVEHRCIRKYRWIRSRNLVSTIHNVISHAKANTISKDSLTLSILINRVIIKNESNLWIEQINLHKLIV